MSALGKLGKGKRKALSQEERWRRAQRLAAVRGRRWLSSGGGQAPKSGQGEAEGTDQQ